MTKPFPYTFKGHLPAAAGRRNAPKRATGSNQTGLGRTLYIGKRKNGKLLRVYEKGKQLGDPSSPWVRWRLSFTTSVGSYLGMCSIEPGKVRCGQLSVHGWVQEETSRIRTVRAQDAISYDRLTEAGAMSYGLLVNVMMKREGSAERVVQILRREGAPRRLQFSDDYLRMEGKPDAV